MKPPCVTMFSCFHARFDSPTFNGSRGLSPRPTLLPQPTSPQVRFPWFDGVVVDFTVKGQMGVTHGDPKKVNAKGLLSWVSLTTLACSAITKGAGLKSLQDLSKNYGTRPQWTSMCSWRPTAWSLLPVTFYSMVNSINNVWWLVDDEFLRDLTIF